MQSAELCSALHGQHGFQFLLRACSTRVLQCDAGLSNLASQWTSCRDEQRQACWTSLFVFLIVLETQLIMFIEQLGFETQWHPYQTRVGDQTVT